MELEFLKSKNAGKRHYFDQTWEILIFLVIMIIAKLQWGTNVFFKGCL